MQRRLGTTSDSRKQLHPRDNTQGSSGRTGTSKEQKTKEFVQKKNYSNWLVTKVTTSPDFLLTNITQG